MAVGLIIFVVGLMIGSFLNVCIWRIPREESIAFPPSHCPKCKNSLKARDLVPVLSFLISQGRCRYCKDKIAFQYPTVELLNGLIYVLLYIQYGLQSSLVEYALLCSLLITISVIDIHHQIIPNSLVLFGLILGVLFNSRLWIQNDSSLYSSGLGLLIGGGLFLLIATVTQGAMGGGDIKLMGILGIWLGAQWIVLITFLAFVIGGIVSVLLIVLKLKGRKDAIPFGPFIGIATIATVLFGNDIIYYYMSHFLM